MTATAAEIVEQRELPESILDATRATVMAVGVKRTTLTEVARRAGVSRMTVYRLVPDVESLVLHLLTTDFVALLADSVAHSARRRSARARLVAALVYVVERLPDEPLFRRLLDVDPDLLMPFVTDRLGSTQRIAMAHVKRALAEGQLDGSIRRGDLDAMAAALLFMLTPFVLSGRLLEATEAGRDAVIREMATILDRAVAA